MHILIFYIIELKEQAKEEKINYKLSLRKQNLNKLLFSKRKINNDEFPSTDINNYLIDINKLNIPNENRINEQNLFSKVSKYIINIILIIV